MRKLIKLEKASGVVRLKVISKDKRHERHKFLLLTEEFDKGCIGESVISQDIHSFCKMTTSDNITTICITWLQAYTNSDVKGFAEYIHVKNSVLRDFWRSERVSETILSEEEVKAGKVVLEGSISHIVSNKTVRSKFRKIIRQLTNIPNTTTYMRPCNVNDFSFYRDSKLWGCRIHGGIIEGRKGYSIHT